MDILYSRVVFRQLKEAVLPGISILNVDMISTELNPQIGSDYHLLIKA